MVYDQAMGGPGQGTIRTSPSPYHRHSNLTFTKIGSVPTPWPSWLIVANQERANAAEVKDILERLTGFIRDFDSAEKRENADVEFIKEKFGYPEEDVRAWLKTVKYPQNCLEIPTEVITTTLR